MAYLEKITATTAPCYLDLEMCGGVTVRPEMRQNPLGDGVIQTSKMHVVGHFPGDNFLLEIVDDDADVESVLMHWVRKVNEAKKHTRTPGIPG